MDRKSNKDSVREKILSYLGETLEGLLRLGVTVAFDPHTLLKGGPFLDGDPRKLKQEMAQLKRDGYLKKKQNKLYVTPKGRIRLIKSILKKKQKQRFSKENWDGKWRGIIFDIPELSRRGRNLLRRELKWIGFRELQKSIWIYPFDIEKELKTLLKLWKVDLEGDIRFILIEKMDSQDLKKKFGLK